MGLPCLPPGPSMTFRASSAPTASACRKLAWPGALVHSEPQGWGQGSPVLQRRPGAFTRQPKGLSGCPVPAALCDVHVALLPPATLGSLAQQGLTQSSLVQEQGPEEGGPWASKAVRTLCVAPRSWGREALGPTASRSPDTTYLIENQVSLASPGSWPGRAPAAWPQAPTGTDVQP